MSFFAALTCGFALVPCLANAQRGVVRGGVYDSVAGAPLAGAEVQLRSLDSNARPLSTTTDSVGRYQIPGIRPGRYLLGFYHKALLALGLDAPLRTFQLAGESSVTVDLAIPSAGVVHRVRCPADSSTPDVGLVAGIVEGGERSDPVAGAVISLEWKALALDSANFRVVTQQASAVAGARGSYILCGVPTAAPLLVRVMSPGWRAIEAPIVVPASAVLRRDFGLVQSALARGTATIRGRVVNEDGRVLAQGRALIPALGIEASIQNGAFRLAEIPAGTWVVEIRAIGVEPQSALIDAAEGTAVTSTIRVGKRAQLLEPVAVIGERNDRTARILSDVLRRKQSGNGTVFVPGNTWFDGALYPADVVRAAHGFQYVNPDSVIGRMQPEYKCSTAIYLNGMRIPSLRDLNALVSQKEVLAIEAYPDVLFAPLEWRDANPYIEPRSSRGGPPPPRSNDRTCSVLVVWTKTG